MSTWSEHISPDGKPYYYNAATQESVWERPAEFAPMPMNPSMSRLPHGEFAYDRPYNHFFNPQPFGVVSPAPMGPGPAIQKGKSAQGPPGFVFHIPNSFTTRQLFDLFSQHGNVISARIMVERDTGRSRGFGFVSYDSPAPAKEAIERLDGHMILNKRLKVSLKKEKGSEEFPNVEEESK